ncbi:hypothetical protein PT2222_340030 [Paraburkholderia tropica]
MSLARASVLAVVARAVVLIVLVVRFAFVGGLALRGRRIDGNRVAGREGLFERFVEWVLRGGRRGRRLGGGHGVLRGRGGSLSA